MGKVDAAQTLDDPYPFEVGVTVAVEVGYGDGRAGGGDGLAGGEGAVAVGEQNVGGRGGGSGAVVGIDEVGASVVVEVGGLDTGGPVSGGDDDGLLELLLLGADGSGSNGEGEGGGRVNWGGLDGCEKRRGECYQSDRVKDESLELDRHLEHVARLRREVVLSIGGTVRRERKY